MDFRIIFIFEINCWFSDLSLVFKSIFHQDTDNTFTCDKYGPNVNNMQQIWRNLSKCGKIVV